MSSVEVIHQIFAQPRPTFLSDPYHGQYNSLLYALFFEHSFSRTMDWDLDAMSITFGNGPTMKPVFIFLILPAQDPNSAACINADSVMRKLLTDADNAPIAIIHGVCVSGTRFTFYNYNREQDLILPQTTKVHFEFNLEDDDGGAAHLLEVAEDIKDMCRALGGNDDLNVVNP